MYTRYTACLALALLTTASGCTSESTNQTSQEEHMQSTNNKSQEITTASGLRYQITKEGNTASPAAKKGDTVKVHYTGWLVTDNGQKGTQFDSSINRGPFQFPLGAGWVIAGWDEGVAGMHVGETRVLTIPAELGYGARGAAGVIPPNATLIFEVTLLEIA
jgi:FKBP-type peptidyl-prolyl cis-trans isomerase FkpA